jgi:perosamine synthetase
MRIRIPLSSPDIGESEIAAVTAVLRTPRLSLGEKLLEFEDAFARFAGSAHAVALSSGTAALHLALLAAGLRPGDEVILPSFTFIAVANAVRFLGAIPVFADIDPQSLNLAPDAVAAAVTERTRALIAVHTFGIPAAMDELLDLARHRQLHVIEDACEAIGGEYHQRRLGSLGHAGVFGFYPNKQITTGEGGMLVTNDASIAARARMLRNQGRGTSGDWFGHQELGFNYRISELNCALGLVQLARLDEILAKRTAVAEMYNQRLRGIAGLELPLAAIACGKISWFVYVVRLPQSLRGSGRDRVMASLAERGIASARYFAPIHRQPVYRDVPHRVMDLPVTDSVADRTLALPFFNQMSAEQVDEVCTALADALR